MPTSPPPASLADALAAETAIDLRSTSPLSLPGAFPPLPPTADDPDLDPSLLLARRVWFGLAPNLVRQIGEHLERTLIRVAHARATNGSSVASVGDLSAGPGSTNATSQPADQPADQPDLPALVAEAQYYTQALGEFCVTLAKHGIDVRPLLPARLRFDPARRTFDYTMKTH